MSQAERHLNSLMRQLATQQHVELIHPFAELKTMGALVYVAECFGFRYAGVRLLGRHKVLHIHLARDPEPWAQQRAATNAATFTQVGAGGPVPGMYLNSLTPVPEAAADVDLICALIRYDGLVEAGNRKQLLTMAWGFGALFLLLAVITGVYAVLLPLAVLMPVCLLGALRVNTVRRAKLARQLTAAGCAQVRDQAGREQYVRPVPFAA
ncbi:hypothetical protein ACFY1J_33010 [Streptomyces sp. NPDC001406]|uniref:hypothetical protein n=1 Tax=Streptomyces sp. NPDC001406 TaxID=3364572 RepID=UPI0036AF4654